MSYVNADTEYLSLCNLILNEGSIKKDRTGTGTISLFGPQMEFDLQKGFPLLTTKKLGIRVIAEELFWFLSGSTDLKDLLDRNVNIWNHDAYRFYKEQGGTFSYDDFIDFTREAGFDLGPIYGAQFRRWQGSNEQVEIIVDGQPINIPLNKPHDQIADLIQGLKENPDSRRHIVSAWNVGVLDKIALPACHNTFQFYVENNTLSCKMYQRSGDVFLGVPFNIASYALLTHLIAKMLGLQPGRFIHTFGDAHIYLNHIKQVRLQMEREPRQMPELKVKTVKERIEDYTIEDIELTGYDPHDRIKGDVSVGL